MRELITAKMIEKGYAELVGGGDPIANGDLNLALLKRLLSLSRDMHILDFGCGCGRLALPLLEYLNGSGHYLGIDIIHELVQFCREEITPHYSNSEFLQLAASNSHYKKWVSNFNPPEFGVKSLDSVANESFDLIILDVMMPKLDGYGVCQEIRKESDVPIIMLTALGDVADRITGLELGADDYVIKERLVCYN